MTELHADSARWLAALLESSALSPQESILRLLDLHEGGFGALALYPSAGDALPLEWYFATGTPPAVRGWMQAKLQIDIFQRAFHRGAVLAYPFPSCEEFEGDIFILGEDAPLEGIAVFPVECREYRLGLLIVAYPQLDTPLSCASLASLHTLRQALAWPAFGRSLAAEKKHLQNQIEDLQHRKDEFIAITSHELRTPLGLVVGHATFLNSLITDAERQEHIRIILRSAMRIKEIIESTTQADNYQTGMARLRMHTVNLNTLLKSLYEGFAPEAERKGIHLQMEVPAPPLVLEGDPEKIRTILRNLIENALTFTDEGGHVRITATLGPPDDGYAQVCIQDDGIGIPESALGRIFERFYQVEAHMTRRHNGMGLGLSVARDLAALHGGRIEVESREGAGSRFTLYLPLEQESKA